MAERRRADRHPADWLPPAPGGARELILGRVRAALADRPRPPVVPRSYARVAAPGTDVVALFAERVADYRATVEIVAGAAVPGAIRAALDGYGARRVVVPPGFPDRWLDGAQPSGGAWLRDDPPLARSDLDAADGVITTAALGIALTGTIVLDAGDGQGRRALSLLPDRHLCVISAGQIVATVPAAIARLDPRRPQTWISGPSATSDIELNRVEGVHGPRTLHVLVVAGAPGRS
jgi:L-lactate dehydrogenase complex protein LldG